VGRTPSFASAKLPPPHIPAICSVCDASYRARYRTRTGLVKRTWLTTLIPAVDYELTKLGRSLGECLPRLGHGQVDISPAIVAARNIEVRQRQAVDIITRRLRVWYCSWRERPFWTGSSRTPMLAGRRARVGSAAQCASRLYGVSQVLKISAHLHRSVAIGAACRDDASQRVSDLLQGARDSCAVSPTVI